MSTTTPTTTTGSASLAAKFIERVQRSCEFPGQRAKLRSGLHRDLEHSRPMHAIVAPLVPNADRGHDARERAWYAIAAMIASLPRAARKTRAEPTEDDTADGADESAPDHGTSTRPRPRNLGVCLAEAVTRKTIRENTAEARLDLLCRQSVDGLHRHLPGLVRQLATTPDAIDWVQLLHDVRRWEDNRDVITRHWLQSYYRARFAAERKAAREQDDDENTDSASAPA